MNDNAKIREQVARDRQEDVGSGDISSALIPAEQLSKASIINREPLVLCGCAWVGEVFRQIDERIEVMWHYKEGDFIDKANACLCTIQGSTRSILTAERSALNFLQCLSATATTTHHYVSAMAGTKTRLLDTRKTLPGLRWSQKYAVRCGGGGNHRMGLYDAFLIKENHIKACGSIQETVRRAHALHPNKLVIVEVETIEEFKQAQAASPDRIMLDNFSLDAIRQVMALRQPSMTIEVSGGIDVDNIHDIAQTGVDYISIGALTKHIQAIDLSLLLE